MVTNLRSVLSGALLTAFLALHGVAGAQASVGLELGIGGNVVVGAWNPLRVVARDVPLGSRLEVTFDHGSLREGVVPFRLSLPVAGGPGLSVIEKTVYVAPFQTVTWALVGPDSVVASGSIPGRDQDARPLDVVLSRRSGGFGSALSGNARVVDVSASQLPLEAAAYDGVRSVIVDGTTAAPRLEALAAAAAAGAQVVLSGEMPASHAELELLTGRQDTRLGAGSAVSASGALSDVSALLASSAPVPTASFVSAVAARPLVSPPAQVRQQVVLIVAVAFSVVALMVTRLFGGPGLVTAALLAGIVSVAAWRVARPPEPQVVGVRTVAVTGGDLALATRLEEHYTLPATTVHLERSARPLDVRPYSVDESGLSVDLAGWRSVVLVLAPQVIDSPLRLEDGMLVNRGSSALRDVLVVGLGPQGDIGPGQRAAPVPREDGPPREEYAGLLDLLSPGTVLAVSGCETGCTVWLAPALLATVVEEL